MIIYKIARTEADLGDVFRLRFRVRWLEEHEPEERYPEREERDAFDGHAFHAVARHFDLTTVGTARIVTESSMGLPLEQAAGLECHPVPNGAELSKIVISRFGLILSGASSTEVLTGLLKVLCAESRRRGIQRWYAMADAATSELLSRCGVIPLPRDQEGAGSSAPLPRVIDVGHMHLDADISEKIPFLRDLRVSVRQGVRQPPTATILC